MRGYGLTQGERLEAAVAAKAAKRERSREWHRAQPVVAVLDAAMSVEMVRDRVTKGRL